MKSLWTATLSLVVLRTQGHEPGYELAARLKEFIPFPVEKIMFTSGGSDANDTCGPPARAVSCAEAAAARACATHARATHTRNARRRENQRKIFICAHTMRSRAHTHTHFWAP